MIGLIFYSHSIYIIHSSPLSYHLLVSHPLSSLPLISSSSGSLILYISSTLVFCSSSHYISHPLSSSVPHRIIYLIFSHHVFCSSSHYLSHLLSSLISCSLIILSPLILFSLSPSLSYNRCISTGTIMSYSASQMRQESLSNDRYIPHIGS